MKELLRRQLAFRNGEYFIVALCLMVVCSSAIGWSGYYSTIGLDSFHYVHSGVSLLSSGRYVNPSGMPEVWFPPVYPVMIGIASLAGRLNPHIVARLIALLCAVAMVPMIWYATRKCTGSALAACVAASVLALNLDFLQTATASLSHFPAMALLTAAFLVWLEDDPSPRMRLLFGALAALAYLTRPETILAPVVWCVYDLITRQRTMRSLLWVGAAFAACVLPYNIYLFEVTGHWFSNKGAVNLASGRAGYYHWPREWIDPQTLSRKFYVPAHALTARQEVGRYVAESRKLLSQWASMMGGGNRPATVLTLVACGLAVFYALKGRYRIGVIAMILYLAVLPVYAVKELYLMGALPAIAILCGSAWRIRWKWRWLGVLVCSAALAAPAVEWVAVPAQFMPHPASRIQERAGLELRSIAANAILMERMTRVAYYAGRDRYQINVQPLDLNIEFACKAYSGRELYVVALESSGEKSPAQDLPMLTVAEGPERIAITPVRSHCR